MDEKQRLTVRILGDEYVIKGSSLERMKQVAALVNRRMQETADRHPRLSTVQLAVLVSLNLSEELLEQESASEAASRRSQSRQTRKAGREGEGT